jgi:hypothetical protein
MTERLMTDEQLKAIEARSKARLQPRRTAAMPSDAMPEWLARVVGEPPPPLDPTEIAERARRDRFGEASVIRSRLPDFLRNISLVALASQIKAESLRTAAQEWHPSRGGLLLLGDTGEGKTTCAAVVARRVIRQGVHEGGPMWELAQGLFWIRAESLERAMRNHPLGRGEAPDYGKAIGAKLLVLDEIGWEKDHKLIASVLAARYDTRRLTIVTSGQNLAGLRQTYGDAIVRRIVTHRGKPGMIVTAFSGAVPAPSPAGS